MEDGEKEKANMEEEIVLPGFRFHPTDEELVGFYLRRKVERKPLKIELIRQLDIYKYDPWDLPVLKVSSCSVDEKEYYFFCLRARKYRNSVRPNRVTGSGFWKATGIDKNIYSGTVAAAKDCIGLKKSLVYYKGKAGKGTKTDWMMHEFRLPPTWKTSNQHSNPLTPTTCDHQQQEAEDWTLCRIFKRVHNSFSSYKANVKKSLEVENSSGIECRNFQDLGFSQKIKHRNHLQDNLYGSQQASSISVAQSSYSSSNSNIWNLNGDQELFRDGTWDQLSPVVDSVRANNPAIVFGYYS